jgi:hypothetical protein
MIEFNPSDDSSLSEEDLKIRIPSSMIISGPSNSGKTEFFKRLAFPYPPISPAPSSILYCYGEWGSHVSELESIPICHTHAGMPTEDMIYALPKPALICLDDLMLGGPPMLHCKSGLWVVIFSQDNYRYKYD